MPHFDQSKRKQYMNQIRRQVREEDRVKIETFTVLLDQMNLISQTLLEINNSLHEMNNSLYLQNEIIVEFVTTDRSETH